MKCKFLFVAGREKTARNAEASYGVPNSEEGDLGIDVGFQVLFRGKGGGRVRFRAAIIDPSVG